MTIKGIGGLTVDSLAEMEQSALKLSFLVIGHSFVCQLEESVGDELRATVSDTYRAVNKNGIPGLTVDPLARMLPHVNELSPSVIVMIGLYVIKC